MDKCPFCIKGKESYFLESENFAAIYNISPILPGHSLVISKTHCESLFELSKDHLSEFMILGRNTAQFLSMVFNSDSFDWAIQEKEAAGQSVSHLHMHVVPRKIGDLKEPGAWYQELEKSTVTDVDTFRSFRLQNDQLFEITNKLKNEAQNFKPIFF
jgi:bis(5'-adenosyl)-triphosphatase